MSRHVKNQVVREQGAVRHQERCTSGPAAYLGTLVHASCGTSIKNAIGMQRLRIIFR
jgi:hypothetical protein